MRFRALFNSVPAMDARVDRAGGKIYGAALICKGEVAPFRVQDENGKDVVKQGYIADDITIQTLSALAAQSGKIDFRFTHDYAGNVDPLTALKGFIQNVTVCQETGCLRGDIQLLSLEGGGYNQTILDLAENPELAGLSIVFTFDTETVSGVNYIRPTSLESADLVRYGAATKGFFSQTKLTENNQLTNKMTDEDKKEIAQMIADAIAEAKKADEVQDAAKEADEPAEMAAEDAPEEKKDDEEKGKMAAELSSLRADMAKLSAQVKAPAPFVAPKTPPSETQGQSYLSSAGQFFKKTVRL